MQEKAATGVSYLASIGVSILGLTLNDWVLIFGIFLGVLTYFTNLYYKNKHFKIAEKLLELEMEKKDK